MPVKQIQTFLDDLAVDEVFAYACLAYAAMGVGTELRRSALWWYWMGLFCLI